MAIADGRALAAAGPRRRDGASGRASAGPTGAAVARAASRPQAGRDRRLVERRGRIDPGSLGQADQGRRREADPFGGLSRAPRPGRSSAIACPASSTRQRSIPPSTAGSCSTHRIALPGAGELLEQLRHRPGPGRVELGGRLVENEHGRAHRHDARDGDPLLLAAGQRERLAVGEVADRQALEGRVDPRVHLVARDAEVLEPERELLADRQLRRRQLVGRRREDDPDPAEQRSRARPYAASTPSIATVPSSLARTTRGMNAAAARASVDLPAPVRPATPTRLARGDRDRDALDRRLAATRIADAEPLDPERRDGRSCVIAGRR